MLVSCCVRSGMIFLHRNLDLLPYEASVESERRQRGGSSAGSAHRWEDRRGRRVELEVWLVLLVCCC